MIPSYVKLFGQPTLEIKRLSIECNDPEGNPEWMNHDITLII